MKGSDWANTIKPVLVVDLIAILQAECTHSKPELHVCLIKNISVKKINDSEYRIQCRG